MGRNYNPHVMIAGLDFLINKTPETLKKIIHNFFIYIVEFSEIIGLHNFIKNYAYYYNIAFRVFRPFVLILSQITKKNRKDDHIKSIYYWIQKFLGVKRKIQG